MPHGMVVLEPDLADPAVPAGRRSPRWRSGWARSSAFRYESGQPGALNLYRDRPGRLSDEEHADAVLMADAAVRVVLAMQADAPGRHPLKGASAVRTQGPSTGTRHPMGHARARGPSLAQCASEGRCGIRIVDRLYWSLQ
jgi:hypothetical protein